MTEEQYVRLEHFGECMKRMDERFDHVNKLADQRFLDLEKRMEQGLPMPKRRGNKIMFTSTSVWMA